mmetsp:Transcript_69296/g.225767  ORF Transcript_69296/g.225767 Transcript_69296/m.225767 type:complete len:243 (+) Transcript_69296:203-931(+)
MQVTRNSFVWPLVLGVLALRESKALPQLDAAVSTSPPNSSSTLMQTMQSALSVILASRNFSLATWCRAHRSLLPSAAKVVSAALSSPQQAPFLWAFCGCCLTAAVSARSRQARHPMPSAAPSPRRHLRHAANHPASPAMLAAKAQWAHWPSSARLGVQVPAAPQAVRALAELQVPWRWAASSFRSAAALATRAQAGASFSSWRVPCTQSSVRLVASRLLRCRWTFCSWIVELEAAEPAAKAP